MKVYGVSLGGSRVRVQLHECVEGDDVEAEVWVAELTVVKPVLVGLRIRTNRPIEDDPSTAAVA